MVARSRAEAIGLTVALITLSALIVAWGLNGFAISTGDYTRSPPLASRPERFGCYRDRNLSVVLGPTGMSIPGSGVVFRNVTWGNDKNGEFVFFEPAINIAEDGGGGWRTYPDPQSMMVQKLYFESGRRGSYLIVPWTAKPGVELSRAKQC